MPTKIPQHEGPTPLEAAKEEKPSAKATHVNMMTDTIIANMPQEGLRQILRGLLGVDPKVTPKLNELALFYLNNTRSSSCPDLFTGGQIPETTSSLEGFQRRYRCLMGCGRGFESMELLIEVIRQVKALIFVDGAKVSEELMESLAVVDADIVQSVTAMQKNLTTNSGVREMNFEEEKTAERMRSHLLECKEQAERLGQEFAFDRGLSRILKLALGESDTGRSMGNIAKAPPVANIANTQIERFQLGKSLVPRMFMGLWQFSSPAWGTASTTKINKHFRKHVDAGLTAYDMADHYGDAEVIFGSFRSSQPDASNIACATKYCVFEPTTINKEVVEANITERLSNINADSVELLQLHWQSYDDPQYVKMAQLVKEDPRVLNVGLCNYDTQHMNEVLESGVKIVSNQVQFSLIDSRPVFKMAESCIKHNVKLLTYGSLCGGFLADKWLGVAAPNMFAADMTPSHRKYFEMITVWGGWTLVQTLLTALSLISKKYNVSISNVATRWVLDHEYVGAVIIGGRMGISEHVDENVEVFSFKLDEEDKKTIQEVLDQSRAKDVFEAMGDCGGEYR
ncbi:aldo/keto reductase-like protein [Calycina marina]|uniref:Aldo/keto reductase-like protein n=1 Tax=Calycina marina TaxID=1763456 RepID=A0A9P7Z042_9HELO|nr:aldo/keto reductase-like protein [Calycina marina]